MGVSSAPNSSHPRYYGLAKTLLLAVCLIWWKFAKAMRWKHLTEICPNRSILFSSTERRILDPSILSLLEGRLRSGALIVADNADASPEYLARVRSTAHGYLSVPFADDVELSMRLG